jgi:hypothetical protein
MFEYIFWDGMGECSSVVEHIPSMRDALDLISRRAKKKKKEKEKNTHSVYWLQSSTHIY